MNDRFEKKAKCYEIADLVAAGKVNEAVTVLEIEKGLAYLDGQVSMMKER